MIDDQKIKQYTDDKIHDYKYMICGPGTFIEHMKALLKDMGIADEQVIVEDWGI